MNWDRVEDNWKKLKGNAIGQWDEFAEDPRAGRIREMDGFSDDEAEGELTDWQQRLSEIDRDRSRRVATRRS